MITGEELAQARGRAGKSQQELAAALSVSLRTVGNWERDGVPRKSEGTVHDLLGDHLGGTSGDPLASVSDMALLTELGRRLDRARQKGGDRSDSGQDEAQKSELAGGVIDEEVTSSDSQTREVR